MPFISIFLQVLVVNVCLKSPSEISGSVRTPEHHVSVTSFHTASDNGSLSYHFDDYFAEELLHDDGVLPAVFPSFLHLHGELVEGCLDVLVCMHPLRGPPVTIC